MRRQDLRPAAIGSSGIREQAMNLDEDGRHRVAQLVRGDRDELLAGPDRVAEFLDQAILLIFATAVLGRVHIVHAVLAAVRAHPRAYSGRLRAFDQSRTRTTAPTCGAWAGGLRRP